MVAIDIFRLAMSRAGKITQEGIAMMTMNLASVQNWLSRPVGKPVQEVTGRLTSARRTKTGFVFSLDSGDSVDWNRLSKDTQADIAIELALADIPVT